MDCAYSKKKLLKVDVISCQTVSYPVRWHQSTCIIIVAITCVIKKTYLFMSICFTISHRFRFAVIVIWFHVLASASNPSLPTTLAIQQKNCSIYLLHVGIECFAVIAVMSEFSETKKTGALWSGEKYILKDKNFSPVAICIENQQPP